MKAKIHMRDFAGATVTKQRKAVESCLKSTNDIHGKGCIVAVVWGIPYADVEHDRVGMVVRQYQYGMDATGFSVSHDWKTVRYLHRDRYVLPAPSKSKLPSAVLDNELCSICGCHMATERHKRHK